MGFFEERTRAGALAPILRGPSRALRPLSVSPRAPRQGRSPGGSPLGRSKPCGFRLPSAAAPAPKLRSAAGRIPRPKPRVCPAVPEPGFRGPPISQLPGRGPVLPDKRMAGALLLPVAARRLASRFPPDRPDLRPPAWFGSGARRLLDLGTSRSLPLSHPLKGKPATSAWRRLRQPPGPPLPPIDPPGGATDPLSLGLWPGRHSTVAGRSSSATD